MLGPWKRDVTGVPRHASDFSPGSVTFVEDWNCGIWWKDSLDGRMVGSS